MPMQTTIMHQLLDRVHRGDEAAFNALLKDLAAPLEIMSRRILKQFPRVARWSDAEDVLQNASLRLIRALREVRPESMRELYALASTLIRREMLDMARHFYGKLGIGANHDTVKTRTTSPSQAIDSDPDFDRWVAFHELLEKLPAEEREVLALTFYHRLSKDEIAELMQVSTRTVNRFLQKAVARLKVELGAKWDESVA